MRQTERRVEGGKIERYLERQKEGRKEKARKKGEWT